MPVICTFRGIKIYVNYIEVHDGVRRKSKKIF